MCCQFHLACVVFSGSILRIHIIPTSYLHYIGFHQHNSYKCFLLHSCPLCGNPPQTQGDCKVLGRILMHGKYTNLGSPVAPTGNFWEGRKGAGPMHRPLTHPWLHFYPQQNTGAPMKHYPSSNDSVYPSKKMVPSSHGCQEWTPGSTFLETF